MAAEFKKNVEAKLEALKAEIGEIAEAVTDTAIKDRLAQLSTNVETLIYETLTQTQNTQPQQGKRPQRSAADRRKESGFAGNGFALEAEDANGPAGGGHHGQQASYGGVAQLFMNKKPEEEAPENEDGKADPKHQQNISFGGIRQLFESGEQTGAGQEEFLVEPEDEESAKAEQKRKHGRHKSIHRRTRSRNSVTDMFSKDPSDLAGDRSSSEDSVDKENRLEKEKGPVTLRQHPLAHSPSRPPAGSWEGVDEWFKDPSKTLAAPKNWEGVATLFDMTNTNRDAGKEFGAKELPEEEFPTVELDVKARNPTNRDVPQESKDRHHERHISYGGVRQLVEDELVEDPPAEEAKHEARVHNRNTSFGGVMQIEDDGDDDRHMLPMGLLHNAAIDDDGPETPPGRSGGHDRNLSYGGVRQIPDLEEPARGRGHGRNVSVGGVRQIDEDDLTNPLQGVEAVHIDIEDDQSSENNTAEEIVSDDQTGPSKPAGGHGRKVSYGGVRPIADEDQASDEDQFFADKDHGGDERRRSKMQDGRELFDTNKGQTTSGDAAREGQLKRLLQNTQDLAREHLQLKMSKIELIKSTAEEIDRLRDIIRALAANLKKVRANQQKLVNATLGTHLAESVSGVFGAVTGFFSPAPAVEMGSRSRRSSLASSRRSQRS